MFLHRRKGITRLPDEDLIRRYVISKDKELIAELFERYTHLVYGICLSYLHNREKCKDAVMEIFESLIEKLLEHQVDNFKNWLYSVSRNHCLMLLRREMSFFRVKGKILTDLQQDNHEQPQNAAFETESLQDADEQAVNNAVSQLKEEQQVCIWLFYHEEQSYQEICDHTGYTMTQVKSHIQNGKRNLRNLLMDHHDRRKL